MLASRIDAAFLAEAGWDPVTWVLTIDPGHPLLGRSVCRAPGCQTTCPVKTGVCLDSRRRLAEAGLALEDYGLLSPPRGARWLGVGDGTCAVPGCPRPWVAAARPLCPEHHEQQQRLGVGAADFIGLPDVKPLPSHGALAVVSCPRQLPAAGSTYCDAHLQRLRCLRQAGQEPGEAAWRLTEPPVPRSGQLGLAGLNPAVVIEVLFGLQQRTRQGVKTHDSILRAACDDARRQQVTSLAGLAIPASRGNGYASVVHTLITHARRGLSGPETETAKDIWDMTLFGHRGRVSFTTITQRWLRQVARIWAAADLPRRRGRSGGDKTRHYIPAWRCCRRACAARRPRRGPRGARTRRHRGVPGPAQLAAASGEISELTRVLACREVRKLLAAARQLGATRPGGPAEGLSDQFALHRDDMPDEPEHGEPGPRPSPRDHAADLRASARSGRAAHPHRDRDPDRHRPPPRGHRHPPAGLPGGRR